MATRITPPTFFALFGDDPLGAARTIREAGPVCEFNMGPIRAVVASDPAIATALFTQHRIDLHGIMRMVEPRLQAVVGDGLLGANGDDWKLLRKLVTPEFSRSRLETAAGPVGRRAERLVADWHARAAGAGSVEIAFDAELGTVAREIMLEFLFGHPPTEGEQAFYKALVDYNDAVGAAPRAEDPTTAMDGFQEPLDRMRGLLEAALETSESEGLVGRLTRARDEGVGLSHAQVRDTVFSILLAGIVDVQWVFAFLGQQLATHREWQAVVREEVALTFAEGLKPGLDETPCLRASLSETMRLFPTSMLVSGWAQKAIEMPGLSLGEGELAFVVLPAIFRSPALWSLADAFVPQRFLRQGMELRKVGFTPFGIGMRACVGATFAQMEICTTMATILRDFELEALSPSCVLGGRAGQLVAREPVRIKATPRPALTGVKAAPYG